VELVSETLIHYFSGTGNSLFAARRLAESLGGADLSPIASGEGALGREVLGFVFPVHFLALPMIVRTFLERGDLLEAKYFFAIATNGGDAGNALYEADRLLRARGKLLNYGLELPMGDTSIVLRTSPEKLASRMAALGPRIEAASRSIARREDSPAAFKPKAGASILGRLYDFAFDRYYRVREGRADPEACSCCGLCARICPVSNIGLEAGRPVWGDRCALCFGCINRCPRNAVSLGRIRASGDEDRCRGPGVEG
jgi:Pyruvate/2-oxoacid:ferredoxin oxidoreductase delta subunit